MSGTRCGHRCGRSPAISSATGDRCAARSSVPRDRPRSHGRSPHGLRSRWFKYDIAPLGGKWAWWPGGNGKQHYTSGRSRWGGHIESSIVRRSSALELAGAFRDQHSQPLDLQVYCATNTACRYKRREGRTVNPSANAYAGSNPAPATELRAVSSHTSSCFCKSKRVSSQRGPSTQRNPARLQRLLASPGRSEVRH